MAVTVRDFREYLGYPPATDAVLRRYLAAAISEARTAGCPDFKHNAQYDDFILALAGMKYDNRNCGVVSGNGSTEQAFIRTNVLELRYAEEDPICECMEGEPDE